MGNGGFRTWAVTLGWLGAAAAGAQPYDKWVDAFFNSKDAFIQGTVIPNIEKNRKSDATLTFTDEAGKPLAGLKVSVKQIEHAFLFGAVPPFQSSQFAAPNHVKLWRNVFNYGICESAFKWAANEKVQGTRDFSRADAILSSFTASGARMELHFLAGYHPDWLAALPDAAKATAQKEYAQAALEHFKDKITYFQVFNEDMLTHVDRAKVFSDQTKFFGDLSKLYPNVRLGINDCYVWNPASAAERFPTPTDLKAKYPGIKFIAMHGHRPHSYWATPQEMYKLFDPYIGSGVNVQLAEFGIMDEPIEGAHTGTWTDDLRAQYFISAYATVFSHPATDAFNAWGIGPDTNRWNANYMIGLDGTPKPSYSSLKSLIRDKLMTKAEGTSDAAGAYAYRGFRGSYEITVERAGVKGMAQISLDEKGGTQSLKITESAGKLVISGGTVGALAPFSEPEWRIEAAPGMTAVFTGLKAFASLEILDPRGRSVRAWKVLGDRLQWDGSDAAGRPVPKGNYLVRAGMVGGGSRSRVLRMR